MRNPRPLILLVVLAALSGTGWALFDRGEVEPKSRVEAAKLFLASLDDAQRATATMAFDSEQRVQWHFIPLATRKGLQAKDMNDRQRKAAHTLVFCMLSYDGYSKATTIMQLEAILHELEKSRAGAPIRDVDRYYFTLFGDPAGGKPWGLSVEGHHLSLNFVLDADGKMISSTPTFFGCNPATVQKDYGVGPKQGTRVLGKEEDLAFELVNSLTPDQQKVAILDPKAPKDIRAAGTPQPPTDAPAGLSADKLTKPQIATLHKLIETYAGNLPADVSKARLAAIDKAGFERVHFAWAGALKPGIGHSYRIQGPTFLVELNNTQPDSDGNLANHIHSVWRDTAGDFGVAAKK